MKKILLLSCIALLGAGCIDAVDNSTLLSSDKSNLSIDQDNFIKKAECGSRLEDAKKILKDATLPGGGSTIEKICYSAELNTCVLEYKYFFSNELSFEGVNWVDQVFLDIFTTKPIETIRAKNLVESFSEDFVRQVENARSRINCVE
ncbi:hypothetical protein K8R04_02130 [Candidatus Uhrbacteria bacterium]|nr:hypothetical protein [Candidatus Uhrbacteria bacterium]